MRFVHHNPLLPEAVWANLTLLGFGWVILIVAGIFDRRDGQGMLAALLALVAGGICVQLIKAAFGVARPAAAMGLGDITVIGVPVLHSGSMPSGHAAAAGATATLLVLLLQQRQRLNRWRLVAVAVFFGLVAGSRVAVGAHWPADVLVGSGLGMLCGALSWLLAGRWLTRVSQPATASAASTTRLRHRWLWMCTGDLLAAALCLGENTGYPQALMLQQALGVLAIVSAMLRLRLWWHAGGHP
jgi:membrane-associated phospholipid phosphatase